MSTRILLVDDHQLFREGLCRLLEAEPDLEVVGQVGDGRSALRFVAENPPDVVIMDLSMPDLNGVDATRQLCEAQPSAKVLCLSMHDDERFVSDALRAGASGYLLKDCASGELSEAVRAVAKGRVYLSPGIAGTVLEAYRGDGAESAPSSLSRLSAREREVVQLIAEGHSTGDIARQLGVSVKTVGTHRENLMEKLGVRSVAGLTKWAIRAGLTSG